MSVAGAVAAQLGQAATALVLHLLVARALGGEGLAAFAVVHGLIVVAAAVVTGFVGDSLTVLDRTRADVRAALQWWLVGLVTVLAVTVAGGAVLAPVRGPAVVMAGVAAAAFVVEEVLRRVLMASLRFWRVLLADASGLAASMAVLAAVAITCEPTLSSFVWALLAGQVVAGCVAVALLPADDRWVTSARPALAAVWRFGRWRALQQTMRPATVAATRMMVVAVAGSAVAGELEAARLVVAPAMLAVNGLGDQRLAGVARDRREPLDLSVRRADRTVALLVPAVLAFGWLAVAAEPVVATALGSGAASDGAAMVGWAAFAAATGATMSYGVLVAVRGRPSVVVAVRAAEATGAIAGVAAALACGWPATVAPYLLAASAAGGALALRHHAAHPDRADRADGTRRRSQGSCSDTVEEGGRRDGVVGGPRRRDRGMALGGPAPVVPSGTSGAGPGRGRLGLIAALAVALVTAVSCSDAGTSRIVGPTPDAASGTSGRTGDRASDSAGGGSPGQPADPAARAPASPAGSAGGAEPPPAGTSQPSAGAPAPPGQPPSAAPGPPGGAVGPPPSSPTTTSPPLGDDLVPFEPGTLATVPVGPVPAAPPVPLERPATAEGVTVTLTALTAVQGQALGPGEVAGPALRVGLRITNGTTETLTVAAVVVALTTGVDAVPAPQLSGPGAAPFAGTLGSGATGTAAYVFEVPLHRRDRITVTVAVTPGSAPLVFTGAVTAP